MKKSAVIIFLCLLSLIGCADKKTPEASIAAFLSDVKNPQWTLDDIYKKHLKFSKEPKELPKEIQEALTVSLGHLRDSLNGKNIGSGDLKVTRYDLSDPAMQTMLFDSTYTKQVYIAQAKGSFKQYLLLNDKNEIESWMTMKDGRVFLKF